MAVLKINEEIRIELTKKGIVICTYESILGEFFDCIDIKYKSEYSTLEEIEVIEIKE